MFYKKMIDFWKNRRIKYEKCNFGNFGKKGYFKANPKRIVGEI